MVSSKIPILQEDRIIQPGTPYSYWIPVCSSDLVHLDWIMEHIAPELSMGLAKGLVQTELRTGEA